jgi:hypothetical protein
MNKNVKTCWFGALSKHATFANQNWMNKNVKTCWFGLAQMSKNGFGLAFFQA